MEEEEEGETKRVGEIEKERRRKSRRRRTNGRAGKEE